MTKVQRGRRLDFNKSSVTIRYKPCGRRRHCCTIGVAMVMSSDWRKTLTTENPDAGYRAVRQAKHVVSDGTGAMERQRRCIQSCKSLTRSYQLDTLIPHRRFNISRQSAVHLSRSRCQRHRKRGSQDARGKIDRLSLSPRGENRAPRGPMDVHSASTTQLVERRAEIDR